MGYQHILASTEWLNLWIFEEYRYLEIGLVGSIPQPASRSPRSENNAQYWPSLSTTWRRDSPRFSQPSADLERFLDQPFPRRCLPHFEHARSCCAVCTITMGRFHLLILPQVSIYIYMCVIYIYIYIYLFVGMLCVYIYIHKDQSAEAKPLHGHSRFRLEHTCLPTSVNIHALDTHTCMYIHIHIYIYICVCVCATPTPPRPTFWVARVLDILFVAAYLITCCRTIAGKYCFKWEWH